MSQTKSYPIKFITVIILFSLILAACGVAAPETSAPNQSEGTEQEPSGSQEATGSTEEQSAATEPAVGAEPADAVDVAGFPVTVEVCGEPVTYNAPPKRAVTNDVNITEIFLDIGLADKLVGYSGVSDTREVGAKYQALLTNVPLLSPKYIDLETLVGAEPDFFFAGWSYGFSEEKGITPAELEKYGIQSYVLTESCIRIMERNQVSLEDTFTDMLNIGQIFGVEEQAQAKVDQYRAELAEITETIGKVDEPLRVFVYDSGEESPFTAAKFAMPNAMIEAAGGVNIFNDVETSWTAVNWEDVVDRNPEYIVIIDYGEPDAQGKIDFLKTQSELADVEAIKNDKFVVLTYAEATPGPRNVARTRTLAEAFYPEKFGIDTASTTESNDSTFPLTIENCGLTYTYGASPQQAVTMNQAATEIMLALGLEDKMVGTAYMDDQILPSLAEAYNSVPVLAEEYPSQEILFASEPDFVYGAYRSAFGDEAAGPREELLDLGINSYLSVVSCEDDALRPKTATMETVYNEIQDIATSFGVPERGEALVADMRTRMEAVTAAIGDEARPIKIFWYDSGTDDAFAGACCGTPNEIIRQVGAKNIFADAEGNWATVSWEEVIDRDPEAIVIIEADWSPATEKIELLTTNPTYASIKAVQDERFIVVPFSTTTLGIRNVDAVEAVAKGLYPEKFE